MTLKIAIHDCFYSSGETGNMTMLIGASKDFPDVEMRRFMTVKEIDEFNPDFVISYSALYPKLTKFPTYSGILGPINMAFNGKHFFSTFDGYFHGTGSMASSLARDLSISMKKGMPALYITGSFDSSFDSLEPDFSSPKLIYCGTNWDKRYLRMLKLLSKHEWFHVYGPENKWKNEKVSYKGSIPYESTALLDTHRKFGVGLALHGKGHLEWEMVTNRLFEISGAGALAIIERFSFVEEHFGDSVLYIDHRAPEEQLYQDVLKHMEWIRHNPQAASEKATRAQAIIKEKFSTQSVLKNLIDFHHESMKYGGWAITDAQQEKEVAVIVRTGGRSLDFLKRNLDSLKSQIYQNIRPVIVLYKEVEGFNEFLEPYHSYFKKIDVIKEIGGINSTTLWRGMRHVYDQKIPYFCILDDDDEYFPNHISNLVTALSDHQKEGGVSRWAYAFWMVEESKPTFKYLDIVEKRGIYYHPHFCKTLDEELRALATNCVLIETGLLDEEILKDPIMHTAEDSYLWRSVAIKSTPLPSFRITCLVHRHDQSSGFATHPLRQFDLLKLKTRFLGKRKPDVSFWATDIVMEQKPISVAEAPKSNKLIRLLKICKKVLVNTPRLMKTILRRIEGM